MDPHQQLGALDALISDGLALQGNPGDLDNFLNESVHDVLLGPIPDVPLPSLGGNDSLGLPESGTPVANPGVEADSQAHPTGSGPRLRRRAAAAAANFTDYESGEDSVDEEDGDQETSSTGRPGQGTKRRRGGHGSVASGGDGAPAKPRRTSNMSGRFSGRLPSKDDEKRLADECRAMAPLLSSDGDLCTLPVIIRAMASGHVRAYLERRDAAHRELARRVGGLQADPTYELSALTEELATLRLELNSTRAHAASLQRQVAHVKHAGPNPNGLSNSDRAGEGRSGGALPAATGALPTHSGDLGGQEQQQQHQKQPILQHMGSLNGPAGAAALGGVVPAAPFAMAAPQGQPAAMRAASPPGEAPHLLQMPSATSVGLAAAADGPTAFVAAAQQLPAAVVLAPVPQSIPTLRTVSSTPQLVTAVSQPPVLQSQLSGDLSGSAEQAVTSASGDVPAAAAAGVAATSLNEQAQQLAVTATLHAAAKTEATAQAQQLAAHAQQHAQASVQAAQQAEELKQTLSNLPEELQSQQAVATVHNLEARAQAHASITSQVVAQARDMHEKAQAHEKEQIKAITQATVLQAHAQSLQASAQQLEAHVTASGDQTPPASTSAPSSNLAPVLGAGEGVQGLPGTPGSTTSNGTPHFASAAPAAATAVVLPGHGMAAPGVAVVQAPLPNGQQVHLVIQQPAAVVSAAPVAPPVPQLSVQAIAVQADAAALVQQASAAAQVSAVVQQQQHQQQHAQQQQAAARDTQQQQQQVAQAVAQQAETTQQVAALQQQIAVLQAKQAVVDQAVAAAPALQAVTGSSPPVGTGGHVLTTALSSSIPAGLARTSSYTVLAAAAAAASSAPLVVAADPVHLPLPAPAPSHPAPDTIMAMESPHPMHDSLGLLAAGSGGHSSLDVPVGMEGLLPSSQPLTMDPFMAQEAAGMAPVVSIPDHLSPQDSQRPALSGEPQ